MPDYFTDITAQEALKCTPAEADSLIKALIGDQKPEEIGGDHGLRAMHSDSRLALEYDRTGAELYIFGEDHADLDQIPEAFLKALGALLRQRGKEYLEFGYAHSKGENDRSGRLNRSDTGRVQPRALNFHTVPVAYSTTGYSFEAHGVSGRTAWTR